MYLHLSRKILKSIVHTNELCSLEKDRYTAFCNSLDLSAVGIFNDISFL